MEQIQNQLNYGSLAGLISFTLFVVYDFAGFNPLGAISWLSSWIPVVFIYLTLRKNKNELGGGFLSFWDGFKYANLTGFIYSSLFAMLVILYGNFVNGDFLSKHINEMLEGLEKTQNLFSETTVNQMIDEMKNLTIAGAAFNDFWAKLFGSFLAGIILSLALRKNRSIFEDPTI